MKPTLTNATRGAMFDVLPNLVMGSPPLPRPFRGDYAESALTFRQR
jgi:hypothetical protein